jgi:putative ABC transport system permease protein
MLKNYFKIALRKIYQHKLHSFINISGLAVGTAAFLLISNYVYYEMSYDRFHKHGKQVYRVYRTEDEPSGRITSAATPHALPKALINDYPRLANVVSITITGEGEVQFEDRCFHEKVLAASSNFFDTFDFPFIMGSPAKLSENINSAIITKQLANKLFGDNSPIGRTILVQNQIELIVAGVIEDIPINSSFQFGVFVSNDFVYKTILRDEESKWYSMGVETFIQFSKDLSPETLQTQFPQFLKKYLPDYLQGRLELGLQPLYDIHNNSQIESYKLQTNSKYMLGLLFLIACAILGISSLNFVNLAIARYSEHIKEIGIRNAVGAHRWQLMQQFLTESIFLTFCSLIVSFVLIQWMLPYFNEYVHSQLTFNLFKDRGFFAFTVGFGLLLGVLNGIYPGFLLSGYKAISLLKTEQKKFFGRVCIRHALVALQFSITIVLIFCVIIINHQIGFMKHHELGFHVNNLIAIPTDTPSNEKADRSQIELFTNILQNQGPGHGIVSACYSENVPGSNFNNQFSVIREHGSESDRIEMVITRALNEDFFKTYRMEIAQGRNFSKTYSTDVNESAIINETAARKFGWQNPIGKRFRFAFSDELFTVIGVVRDIHFRSLQNLIEPLVFVQCWSNPKFVTVRLKSDNVQNSISFLKQEWQKLLPSFPFEYHFIDDFYQQSYKAEERLLRIILTFSALAIGLASLGLFGLSALISVHRTKEIGIRKILGASISNIVIMLSKDFTQWIVLANAIALPLAWYIMNKWLQDFPYRINLTIWPFLLSGLLALFIALLTVSWRALRAATANPVESLRYE